MGEICSSRLSCSLEKSQSLQFFSLVDYYNKFFTSDDLGNIMEFYNGFKNRDELIQWMKERPKGVPIIYEIDGDKNIIVVIPTADFNGKHAMECRTNIFKGLHMVFVESYGRDDFYFNYAHNCNEGIKRAMEYNPKWVIVSNDDMKKIDDVSVLISKLSMIDPEKICSVFTRPSPDGYHSMPLYLGIPNLLGKLYLHFGNAFNYLPYDFWSYMERKFGLLNKFKIKIILLPKHLITRVFFKKLHPLIFTMSFGVFSSHFIREKNKLFDENYINGAEDWEISYELSRNNHRIALIDYIIGEYVGNTLGTGSSPAGRARAMRDVANISLFNYYHEKDFE